MLQALARAAIAAGLLTLAGCGGATMIQAPEVAAMRVHEGRAVASRAWLSLELRDFDGRGGGPLHTRGMLAPPEGVRLARQIIRGKIEAAGLFQGVDEVEAAPPPGERGVWLRIVLDIVVTTPTWGTT